MKTNRQKKILELIQQNNIETQEELTALLKQDGYQVTQATISRDIRELKLTKMATNSGRQKYVALQEGTDGLSEKYIRIFKDGVVSIDRAQNILVVKTVAGMAMAVAAAVDAMNFYEVVGTIAGDDTIMCAVRSTEENEQLQQRLQQLIKE